MYGSSQIPIKNAGRVMEQFVKIVVPKAQSGPSGGGGSMAGVGGYVEPKYRNNGSASSGSASSGSSSSSGGWGASSWSQKN